MSFGEKEAAGFDAAVEFPPHNTPVKQMDHRSLNVRSGFRGKIYDYQDLVQQSIGGPGHKFPYYPGVMPRWDNTARKGENGHIFHGASPELFEAWLRSASDLTVSKNPSAPLVFINSWNEWGEGAHLEPDRLHGRRFLDAVRRVAAGEFRSTDQASGGRLSAATDGQRWLDTLRRENTLLAKQLRLTGMLTAAPPIMEGFPELAVRMTSFEAAGRCSVDHVNRLNVKHTGIARRDADLVIDGWFCGDPTTGASPEAIGYVILAHLPSGRTYFGPILERSERNDVGAALELPTGQAFVGFSVRFDISALQRGFYSVRFIEIKRKRAIQVNCRTSLYLT